MTKTSEAMRVDPSLEPSLASQHIAKDKVTVVIPTLNEAEAISKIVGEARTEGYRNILVVDGYSTDRTADIACSMGVEVLHQNGAGKADAVKTAIEHVHTPYMLFIDGDYTYDPKDIGKLLNHSEQCAHVIGARDRGHMGHLHRLGNWVISQVFSVLFEVKLTDVCSGMYLLETEKARRYDLKERGFNIEVELAAQSALTGALTEVNIDYRPRIGVNKLRTWRHGLAILSGLFRLARRYNSGHLYSILAGLPIIPTLSILCWVAFRQLTEEMGHSGWVLMGIVSLLMAAQALTLARISVPAHHSAKRLARK